MRSGTRTHALTGGALVIAGLVVASGWLQLAREQDRVVRQSRHAGHLLAEEALEHFRRFPEDRTVEGAQRFLDRATRRFVWSNDTSEHWSIYLGGLLGEKNPPTEAYRALTTRETHPITSGGSLMVPVPFGAAEEGTSGLLWIVHDRRAIARAALLDPTWLSFQVLLFVLLGSQLVALTVLLGRRPRTIVEYEKGYLRDHAIGALKLQHRLLGQIIRDHEEGEEPPAPSARREPAPREPGKVIPFDRAHRRAGDDEAGRS